MAKASSSGLVLEELIFVFLDDLVGAKNILFFCIIFFGQLIENGAKVIKQEKFLQFLIYILGGEGV